MPIGLKLSHFGLKMSSSVGAGLGTPISGETDNINTKPAPAY